MVKKIFVDFHVMENRDPKTLVLYDTSEWAHIENKPSVVEILVPGFDEPVVHYFDKRGINYFTSHNLGLTELGGEDAVSLPDGVYKITVKGSPESFFHTVTHLKTDNIRLELDTLLLKSDLICKSKGVDSELIKSIRKIDLYIRAAEAYTRQDNACMAIELLEKAQKDIDKLRNCKTCV